MSNFQLANRYAKSLFQLAQQNGKLEEVRGDVRHLRSLISESRDLRNVLKSPLLNAAKRLVVLNRITQDMQPEVGSLIQVLADKNRTFALESIADQFENRYNEHHGIANATVVSAIPLGEDSIKKVKELLASYIQADKIMLVNEVDPDIIGGIVVRYKDKLLDMSVASELRNIRKELILN
jgi:F-type H+-transporting ATPase subunit delta